MEVAMAEERYSKELLEAAEYLTTVADPLAQGYGSGLHKFSAEPYETLAIIRNNASVVLENFNTQEFGPNIREDLLFLEVEWKIQGAKLEQVRNKAPSLSHAVVALGISIGALLLGEGVLYATIFLAGIILLVLIFTFPTRIKAQRAIRRISQTHAAISQQTASKLA
jgi:hypothetical protein